MSGRVRKLRCGVGGQRRGKDPLGLTDKIQDSQINTNFR